ncbi:MAG: TonB-dependent receptor domain-containing protein [Bryobacteraceae bacterium]
MTILALTAAVPATAQSDRGTITGSVVDPLSASVAGAAVEVRNLDNGSIFNTLTTNTGGFTITSVPSGKYTVSISAPGFETAEEAGVQVFLDQTVRVDVVLQIGHASDTINVTAEADLLKVDNAERSMNVSGEKLDELPINFGGTGSSGGGIRNWLTFTYLAPGVAGTAPNSEVNGMPRGNYKIYLEGQDSSSPVAVDWTGSVQAASVEAITEFAVQSSNFSAEYGQVLGGLYNFTTKSGTNQFHGSVYEELTNEALNATQPWDHILNRDRQSDYGFSVGGPVRIPKLYNGKNRTFFFFNLEGYTTNETNILTGTVPTAAYRQGDFSCALYSASTNCTGPMVTLTDPTSGYQYLENQIFDPASTYTDAQGRLVRNPFPNNMIPQSRMDPVALKIQAFIPTPINNQTTQNWDPTIVTPTKEQILSLKLDQNFGPETKMSFFWNKMGTNSPAYPDGLPYPITGVRKTVNGTVGGNQFRLNVDRTISPTLLVHLGAGFWRFLNPDSSPPNILNYDVMANLGLVGSSTGTGFPEISGLTYNNEGGMADTMGIQNAVFQQTDIASSTGSLTWIHGKHTYKAGFELKDNVYSDQSLNQTSGQYTFNAAETGIPFLGTTTIGAGSIGSGYASFLLGQVQDYGVSPPMAAQQRSVEEGLYVQDNIKATSKLTLEIGLRYDRTPIGHEEWNRQSEISFSTPDPNAGGLPGGTVFAGYGPGRCNCEFVKTYNFGFGPRLSAAYQVTSNTVLRAGWGISYSAPDPWNYLSNNYLTNGMGYTSINPGNNPQYGYAYSPLQNGIVYSPSALHVVNLDPGINSPVGALGNPSASAITYDPSGARPARINQWNIAVQRQLSKDMSIEAAYVGNRGAWELQGGLVNPNAITPAILRAHGIDLTNATDRNLMTSQICSAAAKAAGFTLPYTGFPCTASVAQSLRPFPQYSVSLAPQFANQGDSFYDSLQMRFVKRLSHGLDVTSNYTFSKTENIGGYINADPSNRAIQKALDSNDYPHIWVTAITYRTPKATSNKLVRAVTGNWTYAAALRYASGSLIAAPQSVASKWSTYTFASGTPMERVPGVPLYLINIDCRCIDPNNIKQRVLNPAAWQDVPAGTISPGSGYYNDYRGPHQVSENMNFGRTFQLGERMRLNVRAEFFNVFNRVTLGNPTSSNPLATTTVNNATGAISGFGYYSIGNASNAGSPRVGLLVARFQF